MTKFLYSMALLALVLLPGGCRSDGPPPPVRAPAEAIGEGDHLPSNSASGTRKPASTTPGPACAAAPSCFGAPPKAADGLAVSLVASRTEGVAPLAVFFDASGTKSPRSTRTFHELAYCWTFGDSKATCYDSTGRTKDRARGPLAAHVFETPGRYEVALRVRDRDNHEAIQTVAITVQSPDEVFKGERTVCLSAKGDFEGCPAGAVQVLGSDLSLLEPHLTSAKRLLLHRDEYFSVKGKRGLSLNVPGPGIVGAFGHGEPPVIRPEHAAISVHDESRQALGVDWRVIDIDVDGQRNPKTRGLSVTFGPSVPTNLLLLRYRVSNAGAGLGLDGDGLFIFDSDFRDVVGGRGHNLAFIRARRLAIVGSVFYNSTEGEHVLRVAEAKKALISSNHLGRAPNPRQVLKLHGPLVDGKFAGEYTEQVQVSDNFFEGTGNHGWTIAIGAHNEKADERLRDILLESNIITAEEVGARSLVQRGVGVTVRNNVFYAPKESPAWFMEVKRVGIEPAPERISIYNNTVVARSGEAKFLAVGAEARDIVVANNAVSSPETPVIVRDLGASNLQQFGNYGATDWKTNWDPATRHFSKVAGAPPPPSEGNQYWPWDAEGTPRSQPGTVGAFESAGVVKR